MNFNSHVKEHEGPCKHTWVNKNQVCHRFDGGITGYFRNVRRVWIFWIKYGPEFHGIIRNGRNVYSTATDEVK